MGHNRIWSILGKFHAIFNVMRSVIFKEWSRFLSKIEAVGDCWIWTGAKTQGFGQFRYAAHKLIMAHRMMAEYVFGPEYNALDRKIRWLHLCRKDCLNPFHLEERTGKTWQEIKSRVIKTKGYVKIVCTSGLVAKVDLQDYELVKDKNWHTQKGSNTHYALYKIGGKNLYLHHLIVGKSGDNVDHWNEDGLDNRRRNIRPCSLSENRQGMKRANKRFRFIGISLDSREHLRRRWCAHIGVQRKQIWLGRHSTEERAARAYNKAALKYFGKYAKLNKV